MIHRRLINDDARGVGEALNEKDWDGKGMRQWVTHTILFNKPGFIETSHREVQLHRDTANIVVLAQTSKTPFVKQEAPKSSGFTQISGPTKLMTRPLGSNKFLLRFQNMDETTSQDVSTQVFGNPNYSKSVVTEMSLTANQAKKDMISKRFNWNGLKLNDPSFAKTDYLTSGIKQWLFEIINIIIRSLHFETPRNQNLCRSIRILRQENWLYPNLNFIIKCFIYLILNIYCISKIYK